MIKTKNNKKTKEKFPIYPISNWSVANYGVRIVVNADTCLVNIEEICSVDVEDDGNGVFVGLGIYVPSQKTCYYWSDFQLAKIVSIPHFVAHNGISDVRKLQKWGFKVDDSYLHWDTQLIAHYLDSSRKQYGLKALSKEDLGIVYPGYKDLTKIKPGQYCTLKELSEELVLEYNSCDTYVTYKLAEHQGFDGTSYPPRYYTSFERPCSNIFRKMEERGIRVDLEYLQELKSKLEVQIEPIKKDILNELGPINLDSPKQLLAALNAKGITPILKGKPSTDKKALEKYRGQYHVIDLLFTYSELSTLLSNFVYSYLERNEEVVHPYFNQCGTRTGRPSCSNPNLLQIPRRTENGKLVRRMFVARDGCDFGDIDFGQIEPRIMAHLSKENILCQMFNDGVDFHTFTAERLRIDRERAKVYNLSVGYRATYKSVSQQLKCSWEKAQQDIDRWWSLFPTLYDWQQKLIYESRKSGYCETLMGRRIRIEGLDSANQWTKEGAERQLINNLIQGSAAEIMKLGMIAVDKAGIDILVQIYDELLIEEPEQGIEEAIEKACNLMKNSVQLDIPLTVEAGIGKNWEACKT